MHRLHIRKAAKMHCGVVLTYLKWMRRHYEEKGIRFGELIGGEPHLTGDLLATAAIVMSSAKTGSRK